jgi:hypothetical protein
MTLRGLERQAARLPLTGVRILNKVRGLVGLCLLDNGAAASGLRREIAGLCEGMGLHCDFLESSVAAANGGGESGAGCDLHRSHTGAESLPSCQVSVEEKMQLFSFIRKG